jgi:hypothetical protein
VRQWDLNDKDKGRGAHCPLPAPMSEVHVLLPGVRNQPLDAKSTGAHAPPHRHYHHQRTKGISAAGGQCGCCRREHPPPPCFCFSCRCRYGDAPVVQLSHPVWLLLATGYGERCRIKLSPGLSPGRGPVGGAGGRTERHVAVLARPPCPHGTYAQFGSREEEQGGTCWPSTGPPRPAMPKPRGYRIFTGAPRF